MNGLGLTLLMENKNGQSRGDSTSWAGRSAENFTRQLEDRTDKEPTRPIVDGGETLR